MKETIILDTNVLLSKPSILFDLPNTRIIIPQAVINEIDRMKTARVDRQIRFNGRKVSRYLFKLSEQGNLSKGISIDNGARLQVLNLNHDRKFPDSLNLKAADDQIIAVAISEKENRPKEKLYILTSDLNMLLKAQGLGVRVRHYNVHSKFPLIENTLNFFVSKRRLFSSVAIFLFIILVLFVIYRLTFSELGTTSNLISAPPKIQSQLETFKIQENEYLRILEKDSKDVQALVGLGNLYYDNQQWQKAIDTYTKVLEIDKGNDDVRTDRAVAYRQLGINDIAIRELELVVKNNPKHDIAYYNLGVIFFGGERDLISAKNMFLKYIEISPKGSLSNKAQQYINQIDERLDKSEN